MTITPRDEKKARYILAIKTALVCALDPASAEGNELEMLAQDCRNPDFEAELFFACIPIATMLVMRKITSLDPGDPVDTAFVLARLVMQEARKDE